ncbi:MAG: stage II sporulation protein D [Erysipelotrichaceae bacterium]|nr:stage II sporulation protein D [Erysipelotrichaceae bacterium]
MKTIYIKLICVCLCILLISSFHEINIKNEEYIVEVKTEEGILNIELEEYLIGVVAGEMPVDFEIEALKAQVVASRTFVLSRNLSVDNTTNSQVYLDNDTLLKQWGSHYDEYMSKIKQAIEETSYVVMTYQNEYISALFFSCSNGQTVNSEDYFSDEVVYLQSVDSHWDEELDPNYEQSQTFTKNELALLFDETLNNMSITAYTDSGYVKSVIVNDKTYTGREIRELLSLASSCFSIELKEEGYVFTTYGSGHGVGMSQYGAHGMALEGYSYEDILKHYYQNIEIKSIDS